MPACVPRRFVLAVLLGSTAAAHAQPAGAQAEVLFREGRDALAAGRVAEACSAFEQSQKLEPAVTTLLNLAGCRERQGQLATAWGLFLDVERQTRSGDAAASKLHSVAQSRAKKLEPRISKLTISVADDGKIDGLEVVRGSDKVEAALWNHALPVDGGTYTITARAPGMPPWTTQITVANEGDSKTVDVPKLSSLAPPSEPPATKPATTPPPATPTAAPTAPNAPNAETAPTDQPERTGHRSLVPPIAAGVVTLALAGTALAFDISEQSTYTSAKNETSSQAERNSLYSSANSKYQLAQGFGIAAIAGAGVTVWLAIRSLHGSADATRTALVVTPTGLAITGGF